MNYLDCEPSVTPYGAEYFTGIRASGSDLTVGNVIGAVTPIIEQQRSVTNTTTEAERPLVFVADMHAFTDQDPASITKDRIEILKSYLALGVDPELTDIFIQSQIQPEIMTAVMALNRQVTLSRIARVPTLKDKASNPDKASMALAQYPVMMAADIILQRAHKVPTGKDQLTHIELTRDLIDSLNGSLGREAIPYCEPLTTEPVNILALRGMKKMSKTHPELAILLSDSPEIIAKKIKLAETAIEGIESPNLTSLLLIGDELAASQEEKNELKVLYAEHMAGERVAGKIKARIAEIVAAFICEFQSKRVQLDANPDLVRDALNIGAQRAKANASDTLEMMQDTITLKPYI